jgi:membrane protease YdiL (CAAX protease family)
MSELETSHAATPGPTSLRGEPEPGLVPVSPAPGRCPSHGEPPPGCAFADPPAIRSLTLRLVVFFVSFLLSQALGATVALGVLEAVDPGLLESTAFPGAIGKHLFLVTILSTIPGIFVSLFFWLRIDRRPLAALGLPRHPGVPAEIGRGMLAAMWLMTLASIPAFVIHRAEITFLPGGAGSFVAGLVPYVIAFALVSLNEELSFRGYILRNLILKLKPWLAVVLTSALFAALHAFNPNMTLLGYFNLHLAGALFALSVLRWGSLWYAIAFHFAWNLYQSVVLTLPVSGVRISGLLGVPTTGPAWLTGGAFGPEGSIVATFLIGVACLRMMQGMDVHLNRAPEEPPCATGEECPVVPEVIAAAARRAR